VLPRLCPFPDARLAARRPARLFYDAQGHVIRAESGDGQLWRLPVPLAEVSPWLVQATVAVEDRRFRRHPGLDPCAALRAAWQNARSGRVVSGASTLSMQLARLAVPEARGWGAKLRQSCRALDLERRHDKAWILEAYLNHAPYGGTLVGVEAGARGYFGKSARDLSLGEAALLAGLPQRPSALRPDRHPAAARRRQEQVLARLTATGAITPDQAAGAWRLPPAWRPPRAVTASDTRVGYPVGEAAFCRLAAAATPAAHVRTTLEPGLQAAAHEALLRQAALLPGCEDGAAVVLDSTSGKVLALVGGIRGDTSAGGLVNAAVARRSPGSALKPFLYLAALDDGRLLPETRLADQPLAYRDYRPGNFDGTFRAEVSARDALARSLNTPAVRVLEELGVGYALERLHACGLRSLDRTAAHYGLSLALGGGEVTLLELTNAYAGLARNGLFAPPLFLAAPAASADIVLGSTRPFAPGSVALLTDMLRTLALPGSGGLSLAWKTGTSNGFRDAWCLAYNSEYTVGVWLGNTSGRPSRSLAGAEAAAPVVVTLFRALYRERPPPAFAAELAGTVPARLCASSGLGARATCGASVFARAPADTPLRPCPGCASGPGPVAASRRAEQLIILSPEPGRYRADALAPVRLPLVAEAEEDCAWFVNGLYRGRGARLPAQSFAPGAHRVLCIARHGDAVGEVRFVVKENGARP
jgi:penicillin-binding protein 1C